MIISLMLNQLSSSDLALLADPVYKAQVHAYAEDLHLLTDDFARAWYKLTTMDMGPAARCLGPYVPEPQSWQHPLPTNPSALPDSKPEIFFRRVRKTLEEKLGRGEDSDPVLLRSWVRLAWRCAATHRVTDHRGGCDGARLRLSPQNQWTVNRGLSEVVHGLAAIKEEFGQALSWSDLIVLAGTVALQAAFPPSSSRLSFCGGRTDAEEDWSNDIYVEVLGWDSSAYLEVNQSSVFKSFLYHCCFSHDFHLAGRIRRS